MEEKRIFDLVLVKYGLFLVNCGIILIKCGRFLEIFGIDVRCRTSAYYVVHMHTMSYVSIQYRIRYAICWRQHGRCGGGGDLTKKSVQTFLARMFEASEAHSFVIPDVFEGLKENLVAWKDSTRDQRAACASRRACVHVAWWLFAARLRTGEGRIRVMPFFTGAGRAIISCTTG